MEKILQLSGYKTVTVDNLFAVAVWWHFFSTCTPRRKNSKPPHLFFWCCFNKKWSKQEISTKSTWWHEMHIITRWITNTHLLKTLLYWAQLIEGNGYKAQQTTKD